MIIDDLLLESEKEYITNKIVNTDEFPMVHGGTTSDAFPCFNHVLVPRHPPPHNGSFPVESEHFHLFHDLLLRFCRKYGVTYKHTLRAAINVSYALNTEIFEPHVDEHIPHNILIFYLNDLPYDANHNSTIVYNKHFEKGMPGVYYAKNEPIDADILIEAYPKLGRVLYFNGQYHTIRNPMVGKLRYICIFDFI